MTTHPSWPAGPFICALLLSLAVHLVLLFASTDSVPSRHQPLPLVISLAPAPPRTTLVSPPVRKPAQAHVRPHAISRIAAPAKLPAPRRTEPPLSMQSLLSQAVANSPGSTPAPDNSHRVYGSTATGYLWRNYVNDWALRMTRLGTLSFPQAVANQGISGGPVLNIIINADGSLASVRVIKSAGNPILDQAALEMVKMAAPFSAFPPDLAEQASSLEIRRKWFFAPEGSVSVQ